MTQPKQHPSTSFGSDLQSVLREGANKVLRIKFPSEKLATRFAQRINTLRSTMRKEKHPDWEQFYRAGVYKDDTDKSVLTIGPRDHEFHDALVAAGIALPNEAPERLDYTIEQPASGEPLNADSFLAQLRDQTTVLTKEKKPKLSDL